MDSHHSGELRSHHSYRTPDGIEDEKGNIHIIYDFERTKSRLILMAVFTEEDVRSGTPGAKTRLRVKVNQATGADRNPAR